MPAKPVEPVPGDAAAHAGRRLIVSAFACSPLWGSEPGVGWRWALELARQHEVTVITHAYFQKDIEKRLADSPVPGLSFLYFRVPGIGAHPHRQLNSRAYYWLWQLMVRRRVRELLLHERFDVIHHLTWGSYRLPCFLGGLGVPLVVGPVGGGEGAPLRLYRSWPWRERAFYQLRQLSIAVSRWDPFVMWSLSNAACVLTKTSETRDALPWFARAKAVQAGETGVGQIEARTVVREAAEMPLELLYAGRLLGGKGVTYAVHMMRLLARRGVRARLSLAGDGRLEDWVREQIARHRLQDHVRMLGKVPREHMVTLYDSSDLLVFPSWHDSSGNVVTEALSRGLPVLCLDIGGPRYSVDERCAVVVPTKGCNEDGIAQAMASRVERLANDRTRLAQLAAGALQRAQELSWASQVARAYHIIEQRLGWLRSATST